MTFDNTLESKILDAGNMLILLNLQKPWIIACKDVSRVFEIEYSTYRILNRELSVIKLRKKEQNKYRPGCLHGVQFSQQAITSWFKILIFF